VAVLPNRPPPPQQVSRAVDASDLLQLAVQHISCRLSLSQAPQRYYILSLLDWIQGKIPLLKEWSGAGTGWRWWSSKKHVDVALGDRV